MCATCVAQGVVYVGGAVGALQVLAHRARRRSQPDAVTGEEMSGTPESVSSDSV